MSHSQKKNNSKNNLISRTDNVAEVVYTYPEAGQVMMDYGLYCVGCGLSSFDTIEEGARLHGIPEEEIDEMVEEMNEVIKDTVKNATSKKKVHKVVVDRNVCISAGPCIYIAPEAFEFDDEYIATVKPGAENLDDDYLIAGAKACPVQAIRLFDGEGNQIFP